MENEQTIIPPPGPVDLETYDSRTTLGMEKAAAKEERRELRKRVAELQDLFYADQRFALLIVLQGIDTAGKDSTINSVFRDVGPVGCRVVPFGVPSEEELDHDYLWRYHFRAPRKREVVIFNRSHYESVLVERVKEIVPESTWRARYEQLNEFEERLSAEGTVVLKFFLHISKEEQRERLQSRIDAPHKRWKFRHGDLADRERWGDYERAFADMLTHTSTPHAPWHVVPADRKWVRDVVVARALIERLEGLGLAYPPPEEGIEGMRIE